MPREVNPLGLVTADSGDYSKKARAAGSQSGASFICPHAPHGPDLTFNPLVLFYSRTGTNRIVAKEIAEELGAELSEILDLKRRSGPIGWLRSGYDAYRRRLTKIELKVDLVGRDPVVIGTPIWSGRMTPAVRTLLTENRLEGQKVAFFSVSAFGRPESAFEEMSSLAAGAELVATLPLSVKEFKSGTYVEKVKTFVRLIKDAFQEPS